MQGLSGVNQRSNCSDMPCGHQFKLVTKTLGRSFTLLGSKVMQGSSGVNQKSNCFGMLHGHQIWLREPLTKCNALLWSNVMQGSSGVSQRSDCSGMYYGHHIWRKNFWPVRNMIAQVKGHASSIWGQPKVKLLWNPLWPPNLVTRTWPEFKTLLGSKVK